MDIYGFIAIALGLIVYFFNRSKPGGLRDLGLALFFGGIGWVAALVIAVAQISAALR